jgi:hypothetical protein
MTQSFISAFQAKPGETKGKTELAWETLDTSTLSPDLQALYTEYKRHADVASKARAVFEAAMIDKLDLPPHLTLRFGYKFGRISVALDKAPSAKPQGKLSLDNLVTMINRKG